MPHESLLIGIAEVAVALTGFAGVVVVLGPRASGSWSRADQLFLRSLIENGLLAVLMALLPLGVWHLSADPEVVWGVSSGAFAVLGAAHAFGVQPRRARILREDPQHRSTLRFALAIGPLSLAVHLALLMNALDVGVQRSFGPYLVALLWYVLLTALFFVRLIRF